jgi:hypothetical protein
MTNFNCLFCNNILSSKSGLIKHQKNAKFCLKIQNESKKDENESKKDENESKDENEPRKDKNESKTNSKCFICDYCEDNFSQKYNLERHYETCKIRIKKIKEENEQKKDKTILKLNDEINKYKDEINSYKTEFLVLKKELLMKDVHYEEQLKMRDEIVKELKKEIQILKQETKETYNTFFEKEEKLVDTLLHQNNSMSKNSKTVQNLTIHNYGIKPLTQESVIGAFDSYNSKNKNAFNGYIYDYITGDYVSFKVEHIFYGIIKELKDCYGITDISREKIVFNNNGDMTLTTVQEFIRTNIVMNNIDIILEWIMNLQTQIKQKKEDGKIDSNGEIREMTEIEKRDLSDKANTLEYVYKMFNISKEKGQPNELMSKFLSEGAMEHGKVVGKVKQLK